MPNFIQIRRAVFSVEVREGENLFLDLEKKAVYLVWAQLPRSNVATKAKHCHL